MAPESKFVSSVFNLPPPPPGERRSIYAFSFSFYDTAKRVVDLGVSFLVVTLVLTWLIPILAVIIRLDSKGPIFFVQKRIGYLGIPFNCYKLRTMVRNADSDRRQAQNNDARITAVGKFLRRTNLDELPQFINVLFGDMSLVGPRPFMLKDDEEFGNVVSNYYLRHYSKSGITGMAQIKGYRGKTESDLDIIHRYQWDAFYIRKANIALDLGILWVTMIQTVSAIGDAAFSKVKNARVRIESDMMMLNVNETASS